MKEQTNKLTNKQMKWMNIQINGKWMDEQTNKWTK